MPNVRAKEKRPLTVWVPADVYAKFAALAKRHGVPMSEMLVRVMRDSSFEERLSEAQELELRRRLRDQTVTAADVAAAVAKEAAAMVADVADHAFTYPSVMNVTFPKPWHTPRPIPKLGSRKKKGNP